MEQIAGVQSTWYRAPGDGPVLLAIFGHPDDESFGPGGTLARYAAEGVDVHYVSGTRGEVGTVDAALLEGYASVGDLRWAELDAASRLLGLAGLHWLGYRDSGMAGSPENAHPDALAGADRAVLVGRVVALLRQLRPQVVVTFDPYGGYGHPDHIASHLAAVEAFRLAGDPAQYPEQVAAGLAPFTPQKLYCTAFPRGLLRLAVRTMRLLGRDPRRFGQNHDIDLEAVLAHEQPVTARVDISRYLAVKEQAGRCHRSQGGERMRTLPGPFRRWLEGKESFARWQPPVAPGEPLETDLLAGIRTAG